MWIFNPQQYASWTRGKMGDLWEISLLDHVFKHAKHVEFSSPLLTPLFRNFAGTTDPEVRPGVNFSLCFSPVFEFSTKF